MAEWLPAYVCTLPQVEDVLSLTAEVRINTSHRSALVFVVGDVRELWPFGVALVVPLSQ